MKTKDQYNNTIYYEYNVVSRKDGPAIEWNNGNYTWALNGKQYSFKEYLNKIDPLVATKLLLKYF